MTADSDSTVQYGGKGRLQHLLTLKDMSPERVTALLDGAQSIAGGRAPDAGHGILANLFFEPSTRSRCSFEVAAGRLGWQVLNVAESGSSAVKGESLEDTVRTIGAMGVRAIAIRHPEAVAAWRAAAAAPDGTGIINAGGGSDDHPTQGLLDALTIRQHKPDFSRLAIAICGDIRHSRVARSDIHAFTALGARGVRLAGPEALLPDNVPEHCDLAPDLDSAIRDADVVVMLRIQKERMHTASVPNAGDYHRRWGLTAERLRLAAPDCVVLHPGPMNRGVEIAGDVADGARSRILRQVENGVYVRMALLEALAG